MNLRIYPIAILVTSLLLCILSSAISTSVHAYDSFDQIREKWEEQITGGASYNLSDPDIALRVERITNLAKTAWNDMDKSANRTYLWIDLPGTGGSSQIPALYNRLLSMALAYKTYGSTYYLNPTLAADIISGLDWMYANVYNEFKSITGNWWDLEIGAPLPLNNIVTLMYNQLTPTQITNYLNAVDKFTPTPFYNSQTQPRSDAYKYEAANRAWKCLVVGVRGVLVKDGAKIALARDGLVDLFNYVTVGDGFYEDGSFIQHTANSYTGGYGIVQLQNTAQLLALLDASPWEVTDPDRANLYRWIYDSFQPVLYKGAMMDMTMGRNISRSTGQGHVAGTNLIRSLVDLSAAAPAADEVKIKQIIKYHVLEDTSVMQYIGAPVGTIVKLKEIMNDSALVPTTENIGYFQFPNMDRAVHLRPGFGFGLSQFSNRTYNYEYHPNGENKKGWYTSYGMTFLYNQDLTQFGGNFWATVNKYRIPGTTVDTRTRPDDATAYPNARGHNNWSGGTDMLGLYGTSGMELQEFSTTLEAKKSWFLFDDEVVAIGSGINSQDNRTIETIVENRKLNHYATTNLIMTEPAPRTDLTRPRMWRVSNVSDSLNDITRYRTIDNNIESRWSSYGEGSWISYDLGGDQAVAYLGMAFYKGNDTQYSFDVQVSSDNTNWITVLSGAQSALTVNESELQVIDIPDQTTRYLRIVANGNNKTGANNYLEVQFYAPSSAGNLLVPVSVKPYVYSSVMDSTGGIVKPSAAGDIDLGTAWTVQGDGEWVAFDLGEARLIDYLAVAFGKGDQKQYRFDVEKSDDGTTWTPLLSNVFSSGTTLEAEAYDVTDTNARFVRIKGHGNSIDWSNSISEVQIYAPNTVGPVLVPHHVQYVVIPDNDLIINGQVKPASLGWNETMNVVDWAYLEGTGGYYFPGGAAIKGLREARSDNWRSVNNGGDIATETDNYITLWYDHGTNPVDQTYAYVLLPNKSSTATAQYKDSPDITILENSSEVHAVKENKLNLIGANFWKDESKTVDIVTSNKKSSIMVKQTSGNIDISVADPTHENTGLIDIELQVSANEVISHDPEVTITQLHPTVKLSVQVNQVAGKTFRAKLRSAQPVMESTGVAVIEAEQYVSKTDRDGHAWEFDTSFANASGQIAMFAGPATGTGFPSSPYSSTSPQLNYTINFTNTGTYYVWLRGHSVNGYVHVGIDGTEATGGSELWTGENFGWSNVRQVGSARRTLTISTPGKHILNIWAGQYGALVDKILLTNDASYTPSGSGPVTSSSLPDFTADATANMIGQPIDITFMDDAAWRASLNEISVDGLTIDSSRYELSFGKVRIQPSVFSTAKTYSLTL
ncbi:MAG: hypothetical protein K0Q73_7352, partial [Paenibacillus sp.]|nr:hypothetical protein [Paenibacillus sp.]